MIPPLGEISGSTTNLAFVLLGIVPEGDLLIHCMENRTRVWSIPAAFCFRAFILVSKTQREGSRVSDLFISQLHDVKTGVDIRQLDQGGVVEAKYRVLMLSFQLSSSLSPLTLENLMETP